MIIQTWCDLLLELLKDKNEFMDLDSLREIVDVDPGLLENFLNKLEEKKLIETEWSFKEGMKVKII